MSAALGSYLVSGQSTDLKKLYLILAAQGSNTLSGQDIAFSIGKIMESAAGIHTLSGQDIAFLRTYLLYAGYSDSDIYGLSGQSAEFEYSGLEVEVEVEVSPGGGSADSMSYRIKRLPTIPQKTRRPYPKRDVQAVKVISDIKSSILDTGIVKNTHQPYDPKTNKRYKVDDHRAAVVAYNIARKEGLNVGRRPGRR